MPVSQSFDITMYGKRNQLVLLKHTLVQAACVLWISQLLATPLMKDILQATCSTKQSHATQMIHLQCYILQIS